jgi:hypothetical protein
MEDMRVYTSKKVQTVEAVLKKKVAYKLREIKEYMYK